MALVVNATQEPITIKICGNYFNWKPGQERVIRDADLAREIEANRKDSGLAVLPDLSLDEEEVTPEELIERRESQKELRATLCEQALNLYIAKFRAVIENNQISLRRDLEQANIQANPAAYASKGELAAMRLVDKYQAMSEDTIDAQIKEVEKLVGKGKKK